MPKKIRTAIVTTLINAEKIVDSFIRYHLDIGFDHIYLFFDDPNEKTIAMVKNMNNVTVIVNDEHLQQEWTSTRLYQTNEQYHNYIHKEAMSRQMLNMAVACSMSAKDNIDWLLHIDIDELFYLPGNDVSDHFTTLDRNHIYCCHYSNYEGIPESFEINDFFKEVTLFKKNPEHYSYRLQYFSKNRYKSDFFNYYKGGKMAARVDKIDIPLLHEVILKKEQKKLAAYWYGFILTTITLIKRLQTSRSIQFPIILHYPICGFTHFIDKYRILGNFEDKWFGHLDVIPFHKKARDIVYHGNMEMMKIFFRENVMMQNELITELIEKGFLLRIEEPVRRLSKVSSNSSAPLT